MIRIVNDGTPAVEGVRVGGASYLLYDCPFCFDIHCALAPGVESTPCDPVALAVAGRAGSAADVIVKVGRSVTRDEADSWARLVEARLRQRVATWMRYRSLALRTNVSTPTRVRVITAQIRAHVMERDDFTCRRCGATSTVELVVDHVIPVSIGGDDSEDNLQCLCRTCNAGKGARFPHPRDLGRAVG